MIDSGINPNIERIALRLKTIPESPGVYQHLDAEGKVLYVGKARNLQRRVSSYFSHYDDKSAKIKMLVRSVYDIRVTVVATEIDALLLENSLIKRYQPRYNSMLKDDKSYPYLCITDEEYPRLLYTRRRNIKGQYYGPYPNGRILRELQDIIRQLFQYRTCDTMGKRPCMKHQIGLCAAPCVGKQTKEDYRATIENIRFRPKAHYFRIRPFAYFKEPSIFPQDDEWLATEGSYPSGHTIRAWACALLMSQINPATAEAVFARAWLSGESRVISGCHWQSDVDASRPVAGIGFARLQTSSEFQKDMARAQAELRKLLK